MDSREPKSLKRLIYYRQNSIFRSYKIQRTTIPDILLDLP